MLRVVVAHRHLPATTLEGFACGAYCRLMFGEAGARLTERAGRLTG